jgi:hypothetical protein
LEGDQMEKLHVHHERKLARELWVCEISLEDTGLSIMPMHPCFPKLIAPSWGWSENQSKENMLD